MDEFEIKRKDYNQFLERISRALDESNELQRLILICKRQNLIAHEREGHIANVNELFTELEQQNNLGIGNLSILKTMATEVDKKQICADLWMTSMKRENKRRMARGKGKSRSTTN